MPLELIERQAKLLASENRKAEPGIKKIYWFPDEAVVRLVGLLPSIPVSDDGLLHPFYFRPGPTADLVAPSGIALIRPEEFGRLRLPRTWGEWSRAVLLENGE